MARGTRPSAGAKPPRTCARRGTATTTLLLDLRRVYVGIVPANAASRRLFEKLGYRVDDSPAARAYADEETDVTMSVDRAAFEAAHAAALDQIAISER